MTYNKNGQPRKATDTRMRRYCDQCRAWCFNVGYDPITGEENIVLRKGTTEVRDPIRCDYCAALPVTASLRKGSSHHPGKRKRVRDTSQVQEWMRLYVHEDLTMQQIADRDGCTRAWVAYAISRFDPTLFALAKRRRKARTNMRRLARLDVSPKIVQECKVCGVPFEGPPSRVYCTPEHHEVETTLRFQTNPDLRDAQAQRIARWVLAQVELGDTTIEPVRVRHAKRVLAGEDKRRGRWIVSGSARERYALEAYENGWPIFDRLEPEVQEQIELLSARHKVGLP
jgi:hypothetical protein